MGPSRLVLGKRFVAEFAKAPRCKGAKVYGTVSRSGQRVPYTLLTSAQAKKLFRNLLDVSAVVAIDADRVVVTLDQRAHDPYLVKSRLADEPTPLPWFGNKQ